MDDHPELEQLRRICCTCGREFYRAAPHQKYCSVACREAVTDPRMVEVIKAGNRALKEMKAKRERVRIED
jgi:hypothetical protein